MVCRDHGSMTRRALLVTVCACALSGCGGGTNHGPTAPKPSAAISFQSRVNAICVNASRRIFGLTNKSAESVPLSRVAAGRARLAGELAALKAPSALTASYRLFVSLIGREAALLRDLAVNLRTHNYAAGIASERQKRAIPLAKQALLLNLTKCV
jgi:hypothetical protein